MASYADVYLNATMSLCLSWIMLVQQEAILQQTLQLEKSFWQDYDGLHFLVMQHNLQNNADECQRTAIHQNKDRIH